MSPKCLRNPSLKTAVAVPLLLGLAGCTSSVYGPVGPAPADSVTFPAASTQGWLQQYGTGYVGSESRNGDTAYGIATDPQGNVIVLDQTYGAFPGFTNTGSAQFAVAKFNSTGTLVWTQQFGTGAGDYPNAITTDPQGNIYIGGFTKGAFTGFTNSGPPQSVVIKLNSSGQALWIQQFASYGPSQATSLSVDPQGNLIVGGVNVVKGSNGGRVQLGYVSKLAGATGSVMWTQGNSAGGTYYFVTGVSADPSGNVIAVGDFRGSGSTSGTTYMVAKLSGTDGTIQWQQAPVTFSHYGYQSLIYTQSSVDSQGDIFLGGLDASSGYSQCTVAELANATGAQQWRQKFGAAQSCIPGNVAVDTAGNVVMAGSMYHPFFSSTNPAASNDVFVAKVNSTGAAVWLQQFGNGNDIPWGTSFASALVFVATDAQNHAFVAGTTTGAFPNFTNPGNVNMLFVTQFGQ
ncbi:MAG TPA: SBBP repeat-containing protein [Acidobacteriaceae bacterium]|nr:SBBP repeat-containing protein [Acidobacteriaceae bacterium]